MIPALQMPIAAKPPIMRGRLPSLSMVKHCKRKRAAYIRHTQRNSKYTCKNTILCIFKRLEVRISNDQTLLLIRFEIYPNKSGDDLYDSCSCCGVLDLWFGDPRILKDVIGIEPDLW